jgi:uncharacterized protein
MDRQAPAARPLDAAVLRRWADLAAEQAESHRAELDRINVFPVADGDTGTNLAQTVRAAAEELHRAPARDDAPAAAAALARGALRGARGNSGVILSQLFRGLAEALAGAAGSEPDGGRVLADALGRADELARAAVSRPVEGTVLTVLGAAAGAAAQEAGGPVEAVLGAALRAATVALADTPRLLPVLARAGVVDSGGRGLVLLLRALAGVLGAELPDEQPPAPDSASPARDRSALSGVREAGSAEFDYEVMYLLDGAAEDAVARLRGRLEELGDSVVVVGDGAGAGGGLWHVHVHCTDVGAVLEAGVGAGRPHRITVIRFADQQPAAAADERFRLARAVVAVVSDEQVAELARIDGVAVLTGAAPSTGRLAAAVSGSGARHVVVLPNDVALTPVAEEAAEQARERGQEVVVVPTSSVVQGLAALAVHDPARRAGDDVVAMAEAAAATRGGVLRLATEEALTWAGRCQPGDVLGLVDGEVVLIAPELAEGACALAERMLTAGGELVTVLAGPPSEPERDLGALLEEHLRHSHPEVEVVVYRSGPDGPPLQLGVE